MISSYLDRPKNNFFINVRKVFERFKTFRITFNPDKVFFSDSSMEFVGHVIDKEGINFSDKKKNGVRDILPPTTKGALKKFIGLVNYFRDHVPDCSNMTHPLQMMIPDYDRKQRNHKLTWTTEQEAAFSNLRDTVAKLPKTSFHK